MRGSSGCQMQPMGIPVTIPVLLILSCLQAYQGAPTFSSCREDERTALLQFRAGLNDSYGRLTSWVGRDCCSWTGVACNNRTGRVTGVDLRTPFAGNGIEGDEINPCLLALSELSYLDLSGNNFHGAQIPKFIGAFKILRYLDLSNTHTAGRVPPELGNLSSLRHLDLHHIDFVNSNGGGLEIEDASWLSHLSSLQYLDLGAVEIKNASRALQSLGMLPLLSELHLAFDSLTSVPRKLPCVNFTSLHVLDLSANHLNTTFPEWPFEIGSLKSLDLSNNALIGVVPSSMMNLTSLEALDLSDNAFIEQDSLLKAISKLPNLATLKLSNIRLKGQLPPLFWDLNKNLEHLDLSINQLNGTLTEGIGQLSRLVVLDLSFNQLNGHLPTSLGQLSRLVVLDLSQNSFEGVATEMHFRNLISLEKLDLSDNSLILDIEPEWTPPWQLSQLTLENCTVGPAFPAWLRKMENISSIYMSNAGISDGMPDWFWNFSLNISHIDISKNMIKGILPTSLRHLSNLAFVYMSNNQLEGQIPQLPTGLQVLSLSNNSISGPIPQNIGELSSIRDLDVSANKLSGGIPSSICKLKELDTIYLSHNQLSGQILDCWDNHNRLMYIDMSNNNLFGSIPASICSGSELQTLHVNNNKLSGGFPLALQNCSELKLLDMGNNKFKGSIPGWLGSVLTSLIVLRLQSNMFDGKIPTNLGNISSLEVIDLSHNMLSGPIPQSFANLSAMKDPSLIAFFYLELGITVNINMKGREDDYKTIIFHLPRSIDLSSNNLSEGIPETLTVLYGLQNLNLSRNNLTGKIPRSITRLQYLESLDLSFNKLTGDIPSTMSTLNFLSSMNFSFNDLSGRIPVGGQFDSHPDPSIYMGNDHLCGFPLSSTCGGNSTNLPHLNTYNDEKTEDENIWFYVSATIGFITGFWALVATLLLIRKWRIAYYRCIDHAYDKLFVFVVVNLNKIRRI